MQQEKNMQQLEELDTLESFVQRGGVLPYGPYTLFKRLANRYPLHFIQFIHKYRYGTNPDGPDTVYSQLPFALTDVRQLSVTLEHYLTNEPQTDEERVAFQNSVEKLENRMWIRHFNDTRFTHFLDIDQHTDDEEGLGIQSLFYYLDGSTLRIQITDRDGNPLGAENFPNK